VVQTFGRVFLPISPVLLGAAGEQEDFRPFFALQKADGKAAPEQAVLHSRRAVQLQLNRGEARHTLARWLFFANRGEFRDGDLNEIMKKTSCLSLLSNAAVVWNTARMQKIVDQLRGSNQTVRDEDGRSPAPLTPRPFMRWPFIPPLQPLFMP
jgi:hypothetical protein